MMNLYQLLWRPVYFRDENWFLDTDTGTYEYTDLGEKPVATRDPLFALIVFVVPAVLCFALWGAITTEETSWRGYLRTWMVLLPIGVALGFAFWQLLFFRADQFVIDRRFFLGRHRDFTECLVFHLNWGWIRITKLTQFRYNDLSMKLDSENGVEVMVRQRELDPSGFIQATRQRFGIKVVYRLAAEVSFTQMMEYFFDNFSDRDTLSRGGMERAHREFVEPEIRDNLTAALDAAVQGLYAEELFMEDIATNVVIVAPHLLKALRPRALVWGVWISEVIMGQVVDAQKDGYIALLERRSLAVQRSNQEQQAAIADAQAGVVQAREKNRKEKARQDAQKEILRREQGLEKKRIELASLEGTTAVQKRLRELEMYRDEGRLDEEIARSFGESDRFTDLAGWVVLAKSEGFKALAAALQQVLQRPTGGKSGNGEPVASANGT